MGSYRSPSVIKLTEILFNKGCRIRKHNPKSNIARHMLTPYPITVLRRR